LVKNIFQLFVLPIFGLLVYLKPGIYQVAGNITDRDYPMVSWFSQQNPL
jgi:hypothetical protein